MRFIVLGLLAVVGFAHRFTDDSCPEQKQIKCTDDVRAAYEPCKKAEEAGGSDIAADLECLKYYNKMKAECWPCICAVAREEHFTIKGC